MRSESLGKILSLFFAEGLGDVGIKDETAKDEKVEQEDTNRDLIVLMSQVDTVAEEQRIQRKPAKNPSANDRYYQEFARPVFEPYKPPPITTSKTDNAGNRTMKGLSTNFSRKGPAGLPDAAHPE